MEADNNSDFLIIYGEFDSYGKLYQELEKREIEVVESDFERIPINYKSIDEDQLKIFNKFIEVCNQDEDIQKISHNLQL